ASSAASPAASPSPAAGQGASRATAELRDASGQVIGSATFTESAGGVQVSAQVRNLPPGVHGIHVHAVGRCDPPDFMSAGGHFNPTNQQHGLRNPQGPHAGDLPNLTVEANGTATYQASNTLLTLRSGASSPFDADGSALVIHADPDDEMTDPTGNSGGRIACGVITPG
ncbi:MAG: superoxide dismutase family protein, partial [Chloroflexota bacterium]|nr:superoxide dismutase family protein [Chloroflexota bacterium]